MEMTIGLLTPEYPHALCNSSGGIGSSVQNSARALTQLGHRVHVFIYGQNQTQQLEDQGVQLHLFPFKNMPLPAGIFTEKPFKTTSILPSKKKQFNSSKPPIGPELRHS